LLYDSLIIDTNNLYARAFGVTNKKKELSASLINQTIQLSFKMLLNLKKEFLNDDGKIYLLADNPTSKSSIRKSIYSDYKGNRVKESDGYYRGIDYLLLLAIHYSDTFDTIRIKRMEADDLVPEVIGLNPNKKTLLISSDLDWARSISDTCDWYNFKKVYNNKIFFEEYKFYPNEKTVTLMKVLLGDDSDNIPSIGGINYQSALNLVLNFDDIFEVLSCIKKNTEKSILMSDYIKNIILQNENQLIINHNLVYFCELNKEEVQESLLHGKFNEKALLLLYKALEFPNDFDKRIKIKYTTDNLNIFSKFEDSKRR
jgi:5'-3' exonuclease